MAVLPVAGSGSPSVTVTVSLLVIVRAVMAKVNAAVLVAAIVTVTVSRLVIVRAVMAKATAVASVAVTVTVSRLVTVRAVMAREIVAVLVAEPVAASGSPSVTVTASRMVTAPRRDGEGDRRGFGGGDRDRKPFGDRPRRDGEGDRRGFGGENRKPFGDRQDRAPRSFDRGDARGESGRGGSGPRGFGRDRQEERPARVPNAADLRSANRPDRERSPEIDEDVTGKELDRATHHQIKTLEPKSAEWVARHLVMAGRLLDDEPELAFQHALAASRRGGRLAAVREAVGLTAYAAGHYGEALREFRTFRRISGSNVHLPVMADCERGLGRPDRALDVARSEEAQDLDAPGKVELAIVAAGARTDLGQLDAAVAELEIPQLDINRAFSYSPRLFRAYADALAAVGRQEEAEKWSRQAVVAENALGQGVDQEPEIIDLGWDEEEEAREEAERRRLLERASTAAGTEAPAGAPAAAEPENTRAAEAEAAQDSNLDDQDADYFVSDDADSDQDSVELDEPGTAAAEDTDMEDAADAHHDEERRED
ncbi:tetratricopeptide (TPR) repeat protein [Arthrobacter sp. B2I5]|uniref:hypothetical protein n=1 Tax=Arthrobacter sp. B2I5 TaxID=3042266 RepID=UPI0027817957|nr:hypothetical protein [Arthrobacter sp. B2I5]MDQ0826441.1 tetratricopeptide (TPR) repeat protein [Arthrobacter sp. B2I5]